LFHEEVRTYVIASIKIEVTHSDLATKANEVRIVNFAETKNEVTENDY